MPWGSIQMVPCISLSLIFLQLVRTLWHGRTTVCLTLHLLKDIWAVSNLGAITNKTTVSIYVQDFMLT